MRNNQRVALAGAGVLILMLAAFAVRTTGQSTPPAPSTAPAPQVQPNSSWSDAYDEIQEKAARQMAETSAKLAELEAKFSAEKDRRLSELGAKLADAQAKFGAEREKQLGQLEAKLAELQANFGTEQEKQLGQLEAKLAEADSKLLGMEPSMQEVEKKIMQVDPQNAMYVVDEGDDSGWLGIEISEISAERAKELRLAEVRGVEVVGVESDSPAAKAGLKEHDVITAYDGQKVEGRVQFRRLVRETPPGRTVNLGILRDGNAQSLSVVIGDRSDEVENDIRVFHGPVHIPAPPPSSFAMPDFDFHFVAPEMMDMHTPLLGISAEDLSGQLGSYFGAPDGQGVLVREVRHGTPADKAGLRAGDVITKANDKPVKSLHDLRAELREKADQKTLTLGVIRKGETLSVTVEIEKPRPIDSPQAVHRAQF